MQPVKFLLWVNFQINMLERVYVQTSCLPQFLREVDLFSVTISLFLMHILKQFSVRIEQLHKLEILLLVYICVFYI